MFPRLIIFFILIVFFAATASIGLTLRESVDMALKNNPEILAQSEKIGAEEGKVGQAFSGFLPLLKLEGEYGKDYRTPVTYDITTPITASFTLYPDEIADVAGLRVVISQNLFTGGKLTGQLDMAKAQLEIAREDLKRKKQELIYRVASAYYEVLRASKLYALALESAEVAKAHLEQVTTYVDVGRASRSDLLRAEVRVSESELQKIQAENKLDVAKVLLNDVLGREINEPIQVEEEKFGSAEISPPFEELLSQAYEYRSECRVFQLRGKIGEKEITLARSEYHPNLALAGTISKNITEYAGADLRREVDSWNIYGMASWTIFDGLKTPNKVKEAEAHFAELKNYQKQIKNRIAAEVKEAQLYFAAAKLRILNAKKEVEFAEENLRHAQEEYRAGVSGNLEFLDAQRILTKARTDLLQAGTDFELAKAKINLAVGKEVFSIF